MNTQDIITLPSGAQLELKVGSFDDAVTLRKAVSRELVLVNVNLGSFDLGDLENVGPDEINAFKNIMFQLLGSDAVEAALWRCMKPSLYNGQITIPATFQPETAREDYLVVAWEVMVLHLRPFFKSLLTLLPQKAAATDESPKSG